MLSRFLTGHFKLLFLNPHEHNRMSILVFGKDLLLYFIMTNQKRSDRPCAIPCFIFQL